MRRPLKRRWRLSRWGLALALAVAGEAGADAVDGGSSPAPASGRKHASPGEGPGAPARRVELDIPADSYFASAEGRGFLKYLVRCRLDADTEAFLHLPGETLTFTGGVGLAPEWANRALSLAERRWVSACIYALSNKLGRSVRVNLRAAHPKIGEEADTIEEKTGYPLHEGGFFGNLFLAQPVSYVCEGADREKMLDFAIGSLRLCAQPTANTTASGERLSACGFIITGPCNSPSSFVVGGERFEEVVHSWLPLQPQDH